MVDDCDGLGRKTLALCAASGIRDMPDGRVAGWALLLHHFDAKRVGDTDAGLKDCLQLNGRWSKADDATVARERMKDDRSLMLNLLEGRPDGR